jgi:hypothetical protein
VASQHSDVDDPAASRPPPYDPGNSDAPGNQTTQTSTQSLAEGRGRWSLYSRNARKPEGGSRKRDRQMQALEEENNKIRREHKKLLRQQGGFNSAYKELKRKHENEMRRAASDRVECDNAYKELKKEHENELQRAASERVEFDNAYRELKRKHENELQRAASERVEFDNAYKELKKKYETELRRAASERVRHQKKIGNLEHRHEELTALHIRSVTSIGTGLEPISDETFEREFRNLQDDVCFFHYDLYLLFFLAILD